ncbi:MAG: ribosome-binding factor A [Armatimonadetes bacterium CG_4_10_14_3_um_filter_66_18]|nr:30S ribosome-binding factor RbfA [Armatimonadota bacterium]OIO93112.1 MAG: ribosome-binding factor A [Armatimonadetes bacterium CG2_30_66_41]PIU87770.1 MAG: ribosome-binding factor A [Armatimonadetes bacterium CG06_land_8_20_14_3_00_66_21]PIW13467.1 MAG: ribosome-binding factor A [Armatimonadetes bacterium CG17_big_fil_post_rev_8_21_14_2_50_66_6]PIX37700.1 MAG: ribosome-binding factor A [Armatimonadetes bacterium CG_4_8_14_3_um_filter_66_20]PIY35537.1 MAG: ribosome-binding factor A [Armatim
MPPSHSRLERVDELVRQQVGEIITTMLRDPRVGFATVTDAKTSPDLRHARVFVSAYGGDEERESCLEGLRSAAAFIRGELGRRVSLRNVPELAFVVDDSAERAQRLERVFHDLDFSADDESAASNDESAALDEDNAPSDDDSTA